MKLLANFILAMTACIAMIACGDSGTSGCDGSNGLVIRSSSSVYVPDTIYGPYYVNGVLTVPTEFYPFKGYDVPFKLPDQVASYVPYKDLYYVEKMSGQDTLVQARYFKCKYDMEMERTCQQNEKTYGCPASGCFWDNPSSRWVPGCDTIYYDLQYGYDHCDDVKYFCEIKFPNATHFDGIQGGFQPCRRSYSLYL